MTPRQQPDPIAVWFSHALVGAVAAAVVGRTHGPQVALIVALIVVAAHQYMDAPVAEHLTALGV